MTELKDKIVLPNGSIINNRIAKSAMSENLSNKNHEPTNLLIDVYKKWAESGAGLLITGNIMIDSNAIGEPRNIVVENRDNFEQLKAWADTVKGTETKLWAQLNHPGRQAMEQINPILKAPSAVPLKMGGRKNASSKIPQELTENEILDIINRFANTSVILKDAGFSGVQIHGAHGYLVSQFLSPYTNIRKDKWGGSLENRARFVVEVYRKMREKVGKEFPIGIKLNSADFQKGGFSEEESIEVVKILSKEGIDLIEISGGTYEAPVMMGKRKESTAKREAYFMDYIEKARKVTKTPLMLTGGFRTPEGMKEAILSDQLDIIGMARPFTIYPQIAHEIFEETRLDFTVNIKKTGIKAIDAMMNIIWYEKQIKRLGQGKAPHPNLSPWSVLLNYAWLIIEYKFLKK
ncbi:NADH:flavin oxidoreductase/NADH oxidase family protein [Flammeovirga yaeyamensis]|uniref:NADH:flavin oxidoreductase/NADH oxidase family protein n=1 Tax=Flammeovirga yaeyamensis TaxID=367791 RepID=A0AAX1N1Q9_9BACT|nr:NADH:flavin oxidoreductase/NADH oxidase family protein [Flammeovirga yaeyamensis]MBB3696467.1 2,4-dienoyl-CoA reductase-like NADH-dependent reductase (Old Yellow Enzyme family) [Flammeovirga yaeyamensis]NMF35145.1 NADH:flavin oxidoreductase/NADH oxidase family protein [Flammeovirga yaeyamensis]QWG00035.1 NADH:flavin oxidoreductase/NADH oxidase family protein [Flammeovirga yaeyamensis]